MVPWRELLFSPSEVWKLEKYIVPKNSGIFKFIGGIPFEENVNVPVPVADLFCGVWSRTHAPLLSLAKTYPPEVVTACPAKYKQNWNTRKIQMYT